MASTYQYFRSIAFCLVVFSIVLTGCGGSGSDQAGNSGEAPSKANAEPVTLNVFQTGASISNEEFQRLFVEPVAKKYPNITLKLSHESKTLTPESIVTSGDVPDIVFGALASVQIFSDLKANSDLSDLVKKNAIDLNKFDPTSLESIRVRSPQGALLALPFSINFGLIYYNKDIFDKFAVSYPTKSMTWDDAAQLAKKVTQTSGGTQYHGLIVDSAFKLGEQLGLPIVDPKTNKAVLAADGWKRVYDVMKLLNDIPGNALPDGQPSQAAFLQDQTLAMLFSFGARLGEIEEMYNQGKVMNWSIASLPSFPEAKGNKLAPDVHLLMISSTSKHREDAFKVLSLVTSDKAQKEMGKGGRLSSLKNTDVKKSFGTDLKSLKGIDLQPILDYVATPEPPYSKYMITARKQINPAMTKALSGNTDINTALNGANELADKAIAAEMVGSGK